MATKKKATETRTKAAVGRERRLALALRAVLDQQVPDNENLTAEANAIALLDELGYSDLESIPKRVAALNAQLKSAVEAGDGATIAALGKELQRAQTGRHRPRVKGRDDSV